ncbi:MAG: cell division protein FtsK [Candidatus Omnitrophica bacterium CG22_combo_CG10-13_8_21_14_all_43_16]|nr:MAG: cell division protein FtsK [Candidatus Omnitrophica bacterium CG22_combo_CG10-13_8_21_14_all_43_16]
MIKDKKDLIVAIGLFVLALLLLAGMISYSPYDIGFETSTPNIHIRNYIGIIGAYTAWAVFKLIGYAGFFIPFLFVVWGIGILAERLTGKKTYRILGILFLFSASSAFFSLTARPDSVLMVQRGGLLGFLLTNRFLLDYLGAVGGYIVTVSLSVLALLIATEFLIVPVLSLLFMKLWAVADKIGKARKPRAAGAGYSRTERSVSGPRLRPAVKIEKKETREKIKEGAEKEQERPRINIMPKPPGPKPKPAPVKAVKVEPRVVGDYKLPSLELLNSPTHEVGNIFGENLEESARILEDTLRDFGIESKVIDISKGPVITRYELQPAPGVKVNRITSLSDDIALTMKATTVRIVAPIPGKSCVGIEVPNADTSMVFLREILESSEFQKMAASSKLAMALGKDISGKCVVTDLGDMPHLLIAGTTGSGKTVCVNSLIMSMVYNATPEELKFLMVDPKMVELAIYNGLPHLLCPVVTDSKKVAGALGWVVGEMEARYKMLAKIAARNIDSFNQKSEEKLPYIVVIIDELADLMMVAQEDIENAITRLAQLSRAVGIHMILATQRPSVDVVTGVIKANFPARISFKVASKVDSRTVLDMNGADKLLGKGDMLFLEPGSPKPIRAQGTFLTDPEIEKVVGFIKSQQEPVYDNEILEHQKKSISGRGGFKKDEFFDEAVQMVLETGQASVSMLQRRLRLGYTRAARIVDAMEEEGIIGPFRGSKPREILIQEYQPKEEEAPKEQSETSTEETAQQ